MVKVTDKQYYLDGYVEQIGDSMADRVTKKKQDILCIFTGQEGSGKTNASIALAYYVAYKTGRKFDVNNVFFNIDEMTRFAGETKEQIILWDEAALGGLAADWTNSAQRKLKAMLMVCRKKRHVFLFNVPRFYRLNGDIIERAYCMFHIYENDKEEPGNFMFFGRDRLEILYVNWKSKRYASYWKFKKLHGCFGWVLPDLIDEEAYEAKKDAAILALVQDDNDKEKKKDKKDIAIGLLIKYLQNTGLTNTKIAELMSVSTKSLNNWELEPEVSKELFKLVPKKSDGDDEEASEDEA